MIHNELKGRVKQIQLAAAMFKKQVKALIYFPRRYLFIYITTYSLPLHNKKRKKKFKRLTMATSYAPRKRSGIYERYKPNHRRLQ